MQRPPPYPEGHIRVAAAQRGRGQRGGAGVGTAARQSGIRPSGSDIGDQKRIMTPGQAQRAGADYLVIGRPILAAPKPSQALASIIAEME